MQYLPCIPGVPGRYKRISIAPSPKPSHTASGRDVSCRVVCLLSPFTVVFHERCEAREKHDSFPGLVCQPTVKRSCFQALPAAKCLYEFQASPTKRKIFEDSNIVCGCQMCCWNIYHTKPSKPHSKVLREVFHINSSAFRLPRPNARTRFSPSWCMNASRR